MTIQNASFCQNIIKQKWFLVAIVFSLFIIFPVYGAPTTNPATGVTGSSATLNGVTDVAGDYWFEYSPTTGGYTMATGVQTLGAGVPVTATVDGIPLVPGNTYYFRLARDGSSGAQQSFATPVIAVLPTTTYTEAYFTPFVAAKWNMTLLAPIVTGPYFDKFGYLIWAIFWGAIMMAFWVRQEDVTLPAFVYLIVFTILSLETWLPSTFVVVSYVFAGISIGAILYTLYRGRKHG